MKRKKKHVRVPVAYTTYRLKSQRKMKPLELTEYGKKRISVSVELQDYGQWSNTFWHEWFHAAFHELGYDRLADNEPLVEALAQSLMRFFGDAQGRLLLQGMLKDIKPK